ncbi:MAG: YcfL family protein [Planctomycetota bacterium]
MYATRTGTGRRLASIGFAGIVAATLGGCCASGMKDSRVSISPEIDGDIKLRSLNAGVGPGGRQLVEAEIGNCERHPEQFQYRVTWLDADGLTLPMSSAEWTTETLAAKNTQRLRLIAPVAEAETFSLELIDVEDDDRLLWWPFNYFFGRR